MNFIPRRQILKALAALPLLKVASPEKARAAPALPVEDAPKPFDPDSVLDKLFGHPADYEPLRSVWVALHKTAPRDDASGAEIAGRGYKRVRVGGAGAVQFSPVVDGHTSNDDDIIFPEAIKRWGRITHISIWDAERAGNMLFWGKLTKPKTIKKGQAFVFCAGDLHVAYPAGLDLG